MTFHTHHLTPAARLALKIPGNWAWALILRMGWATTRCQRAEHGNGSQA